MNSRRTFFTLLLLVSAASLLLSQLAETTSSATQPDKSGRKERKLWQHLPHHLPVKIKVKNLHNEKFLRGLEVEAKNVSDRPIYFLDFIVIMPEVLSDEGFPVGHFVRYGRMALLDFKEPLQPSDVPIQPGETVVLKVPQKYVEGWEAFASKRKLPKSEPKKVEIFFQQINFGDGTGFLGTGATPIPNKQVSKEPCGGGKFEVIGKLQVQSPA